MTDQTIQPGENVAETMRKVMETLGMTHALDQPADANPLLEPILVSVPNGRKVENLTPYFVQALELTGPIQRKGTARLQDLQSLIDWTNRFKSKDSALFANADMKAPSLTAIADYHAAGPVTVMPPGRDEQARRRQHRGVYAFVLSDEWIVWNAISGKAMGKDEMGEFIEANAKDIQDPTPAILQNKTDKAEPWEQRLITTAAQIEGRFGQLAQLLAMSRHFQVFETSNLEVKTNRDTGEQEIQFLNEHRAKDGAPLKVPNLIIIAIPVFQGGALYRMPVRFRYRKAGSEIKFSLSIYNPEKSFRAAFDEATEQARTETDLPLFCGIPE